MLSATSIVHVCLSVSPVYLCITVHPALVCEQHVYQGGIKTVLGLVNNYAWIREIVDIVTKKSRTQLICVCIYILCMYIHNMCSVTALTSLLLCTHDY